MISFILNRETIHTDLHPGVTVLDFIRYHRHLKGTKIGCREGDCGACAIMVGEKIQDRMQYRTMTSCLMSLGNAGGKHIVTIEGINPPDKSLTPVQSAIVEENGTQCGFCTVGFVMSLTCFCLDEINHTHEEAISAMDGNICRCTGYKSLERAASRLVALMDAKDGLGGIRNAIYAGIVPEWFADIGARLNDISKKEKLPINANQKYVVLSGGTDLYVQRAEEMNHLELEEMFDMNELKQITETGDVIEVGGSATVTDLMTSPVMNQYFPNLQTQLKLVSSTPIRNMATVAGNLVNASPIGDLTIWFLALDATVILSNGKKREIPLRDFYQGYKIIDKAADEVLEKIRFRKPGPEDVFNFEKVSKRKFLDIATVNTAIYLRIRNDIIEEAHVSAGGVSPIPLYLRNLSSCLMHKKLPLDHHTWQELDFLLQSEIAPISDVRGSESYKRTLLEQLFHAHFEKLVPHHE